MKNKRHQGFFYEASFKNGSRLIVVFLILGIFLLNFIYAAGPFDAVQDKIESIEDTKVKVEDSIEKSRDQKVWEEKWDYLGKEWQKLLLKRESVAKVDEVFNKFSLVFSILFGTPYSMSLVLFCVIFLWLFLLFNMVQLVGASGLLEGPSKWLGGVIVSVILAQLGFYQAVILFLGDIIFAPKYSWMRFLVFLIIVGAIILIRYGDRKLAVIIRKKFRGSAEQRLEKFQKGELRRAEAREKSRKDAASLVKD